MLVSAGRPVQLLSSRLSTAATPETLFKLVPAYTGSLGKVARIMKLASVSSLVGATAAVPFFFAANSDVPSAARTVLAVTTIGMTSSSTLLVSWFLKPYITSIHLVSDTSTDLIAGDTPLLVETLTFLARPYTRLVFPEQLVPATMPMTSWMAQKPSDAMAARAQAILEQINGSRKKSDQVQLAQQGDTFYVHTQGQASELMKKIIAAVPPPSGQ
ncbi:mitochondrial proton-transporting ATP synthase complex assembly [Coemansia sp. RSA 1933]|nr:mitochondrial proton-transporting ATP synthase complex assembly [Coemansia sp. RSA 1933]